MEKTETKNSEEQVLISWNGTEYREADLNEEQLTLAIKLNIAAKKLARLQEAYDDYVITNEYKDICVKSFDRAINPAEVEPAVVEEE